MKQMYCLLAAMALFGPVACKSSKIDNDRDGVPESIDCDDHNPNVRPGTAELCGNLVDDNCQNGMNEGCTP